MLLRRRSIKPSYAQKLLSRVLQILEVGLEFIFWYASIRSIQAAHPILAFRFV